MKKTVTKKRKKLTKRLTKRKTTTLIKRKTTTLIKRKTQRKGGKNCKTKCKAMFVKEVQQNTKYKAINKMASFFGKQKYVAEELNKVLDDKDIQNDPVFKECIKDCNK